MDLVRDLPSRRSSHHVANGSIAPAEHAEAGDIGVFEVHVGASVVPGLIANEQQIRKPRSFLYPIRRSIGERAVR